ncbi:retrovirus-related Pol polyprotein from type-1 retrotransposable element R1 4 [Trichonephila clavipes]|nr:retrovirus-related Pol polyprotein from type-1 retrotransposable element R1 4 [Trichonephila clavipes]
MYPDLFLIVFNSCLRLKTFPRCWKKARIILFPKVNDVRVPKLDNLRCISLLSTLGKCFERLIINRVAWRLYKDNYFNKNQLGFMPQKCTEDALNSNQSEKILRALGGSGPLGPPPLGAPLSLVYKQDIVPFICYGSRIWGSALKKKINSRLLRKIERRVLRVIPGYRTISCEAVFAISGFPPIDIFIIRNNEFKIATKNCTNGSLDGSLRVSELPHPSERFPLNLVNYRKNIENIFPVVCFKDGSKINNKVGLAFVIFQDFIEIETRQFRIRDECSVFQAELLCISSSSLLDLQ